MMRLSPLLALVLLLSQSAHAESLIYLNANANSLINAAASDVQFLLENAARCTKNSARLRDKFLFPANADLENFRALLAASFAAYIPTDEFCPKPSDAALKHGILGASTISKAVTAKLTQASTPQLLFFGMSGDQVMELALSADPAYPDCIASNKDDPKSTVELKTYYAMKEKFRLLQLEADSLVEESDLLLRGKGTPVCLPN